MTHKHVNGHKVIDLQINLYLYFKGLPPTCSPSFCVKKRTSLCVLYVQYYTHCLSIVIVLNVCYTAGLLIVVMMAVHQDMWYQTVKHVTIQVHHSEHHHVLVIVWHLVTQDTTVVV